MQDQFAEYLTLFSGSGDYKVTVRVDGQSGMLARRQMNADEIVKLIDPEVNLFLDRMAFDDTLLRVVKYELDLPRKTITIHTKTLVRDSDLKDS